jgi:hypothetical protein
MVNGCWLALLAHGLPITKSIWHWEWSENNRTNKIMLDLNQSEHTILS